MRPSAPILFLALACSLSVATGGNAWSEPGQLISHKKISQPILTPLGVTLTDGDEFGDNVTGLGDLDGAGPSATAVVVAANNDNDGGSNRGAVYIFFLDGAGDVLSRQKISDLAGNFTGTLDDDDQFGTGLAWLGDLDGEGPSVATLAVGTINDDDGGSNRGAVYILFLNAAGTVLSHTKISNLEGGFSGVIDNGDEFGGALCSLGDLDGPGPSAGAMAVGANRDDDGGLDRGAAWILYLSSSGTVLSHAKISSDHGLTGLIGDTDGFGEKIENLGDLDGPGPSAVAIASSAVSNDDGGNDRGAVHVVFLSSAGSVVSHQSISNTQGNFTGLIQDEDGFGSGIAALGDLDGPGPSAGALAVGLANADGGGFDRGVVYVLLLDSTGNCLSYQEIGSGTGTLVGLIDDTDSFGSAMAAAGDFDGPSGGVQTLIVGVGLDDDGGTNRGAAYLLKLDGVNSPVGVGDPPTGRLTVGVAHVRPNPFRLGTNVSFRLSGSSRVRIDILDLSGRLVRRLVDRQDGPGDHQVTWDGRNDSGRPQATGAYLVRMSVDGRATGPAAKAVLLR